MRCLVTMKKHTTVTITKEMLEDWCACPEGVAAVINILPIKISTSPEKNLALAIRMSEHDRAASGWCDVRWLAANVVTDYSSYNADGDYMWDDSAVGEAQDVMLLQQQLAMVADRIATEQGK